MQATEAWVRPVVVFSRPVWDIPRRETADCEVFDMDTDGGFQNVACFANDLSLFEEDL